MNYKIALIGGDGIGPEVLFSAKKVLEEISKIYGHTFDFREVLAGGAAIDFCGEPLPKKSIDVCKESDAVLLGAVGGTKWDALPGDKRPEKAILGLRKQLNLFANIRPARINPALINYSPLRQDIVSKGIDLVFVRELTGGIYYGERGRKTKNGTVQAFDTEVYSEKEVLRIGKYAFELAMKRRKNLVSVDKANVLESSRLWRETMHALSKGYPEVIYSDMLVDNASMQLVRNPSQFDVLVTANMFGDILSDEASVLTGSIGLLPSASVRDDSFGLYEPIHGSAPDIAGKGKANPIAAILSAAMMLRLSFSLFDEALCIENAVDNALSDGCRTADISKNGEIGIGTSEMTEKIISYLGKK